VVFQNRLSAHQSANGEVSGFMETIVSLTNDDSAVPWVFRSAVDCLLVEGGDAWVGGTVVESSTERVLPGVVYLVLIRDRGGPGRDVMHARFAKDVGDARCSDKPAALAETEVSLGDYVVRQGAPSAKETSGTLRLTTTTSGADRDADGYEIDVAGALRHPLKTGETLTLASLLAPGAHVVRLGGVASNCAIFGGGSRTVAVRAGESVPVAFAISCAPISGSVRVRTVTTGVDLDVDGYHVLVDGGGPRATVAANGSVTVGGLGLGSRSIGLGEVAGNCAVAGGTRSVTISAPNEVIDVDFAVSCAALGSARVTISTTGSSPDVDGYTLTVRAVEGSGFAVASVAANATVTVPRLVPGRHTMWLQRVAGNCAGPGVLPQQFDVASGSVAVATLSVVCEPATRLAYVSEAAEGNTKIYTILSNGADPIRLTNHAGSDEDPAWAPDGTRLAFTSSRDGGRSIHVMNEDGSGVRRLTTDTFPSYRPAWSPDGSRIAFVSQRESNTDVYVMNADGTNLVRLTDHPAADVDPAWSPDGARIAFASERDGNMEIYVMNADGSGAARVTVHDTWDGQPAWSPDGRRLAFARYACSQSWYYGEVCYPLTMVADASGASPVEVGVGEDPHWSPDGSRLAVTGLGCDFYYGSGPCSRAGIEIVSPFRIDNYGYADVWDRSVTRGIHANPAWR
jgi:TolB protein